MVNGEWFDCANVADGSSVVKPVSAIYLSLFVTTIITEDHPTEWSSLLRTYVVMHAHQYVMHAHQYVIQTCRTS
jgi:hypothetical protein